MDPPEATWRRTGDSAAIEWGGATWTLAHDGGRFGLRRPGEPGERLALRGLAAVGRRDDRAFAPASLVAIDVFRTRLLATFEPPGWNGLTVRAAWGPDREGRGMDLEVQASTSTVGELRRLEVLVGSHFEERRPGGALVVAARDRSAASLSYDGRETDQLLARLSTLPVPTCPPPVEGGEGYFELVHPQDLSRMLVESEAGSATDVQYALFGYDLERGVVLRGRLRGLQEPETPSQGAIDAEYRRFLEEPPPLRTA